MPGSGCLCEMRENSHLGEWNEKASVEAKHCRFSELSISFGALHSPCCLHWLRGAQAGEPAAGTKKAAAALAVGVGSFSDPVEAQGLSHFLEVSPPPHCPPAPLPCRRNALNSPPSSTASNRLTSPVLPRCPHFPALSRRENFLPAAHGVYGQRAVPPGERVR